MKLKNLTTIALLLLTSVLLAGCTGDKDNTKIIDNSNSNSSVQGIMKITPDKTCTNETNIQKQCPQAGEEVAVISTNYGDITIKFFEKDAPKTVENFKKLAGEGFYDNLTFHRIIKGFMIQGGDPDGTGSGGPGYTVPAEISSNLSHVAGAVATARQGDAVNPEKASSGSQFYIVHNDTGAKGLDGEYTIFAQVVEGQNVVNEIAQVKTGFQDKPVDDVVIESIKLQTYEE